MALPISYRFEYFENVISKHHLNKIDWRQSAKWAFNNKLGQQNVSIASIKQLDNDNVEIIKRFDQNRGYLYNMGFDQYGLYERVIINRKDFSVAVDRMDANWWIAEPFLGQRDLFYVDA
tara:strand:- start:163 stop:519 length:357 start_codon:yes stop_codon:yes gene_type:complete